MLRQFIWKYLQNDTWNQPTEDKGCSFMSVKWVVTGLGNGMSTIQHQGVIF